MSKSKSKSGSGSGSIPALSGAWPSQHRNSTVGPPGFSCPNPSRGPLDTDTDTDTEPELACFAIDRFERPLAGNGYPRQKYGSRRCPIPPPWPWPGRKRHRASAPLREDLRMGRSGWKSGDLLGSLTSRLGPRRLEPWPRPRAAPSGGIPQERALRPPVRHSRPFPARSKTL